MEQRDGAARLLRNFGKAGQGLGRHAVMALLLSSALPSVAFAQAAAPADVLEDGSNAEQGVGEIVVTAQKRSESINKVGMSISAFDGNELTKRGIQSTEDLVKIVPGFTIAKTHHSNTVFTLRGVGYYDNALAGAPTVSIYTDEVPLPYTQMTAGANLDVERIEVLKGPQGTLFGSNATGGAINYVAAKPTDHFTAGADLSIARFGAFEGSAFVSGPLSSTLKARLAFRTEQGGAWQISQSNPSDRLGNADRVFGRLLLDWEPTDRLTVQVNLNGWLDRSDSQAGQFVVTNFTIPIAPDPALAVWPTPPMDNRIADWDKNRNFASDNRFWQAAVRATYELNDIVKLTSISSYAHYNPDTMADMDGTSLHSFLFSQSGHIDNFFQEIRAEVRPNDALNLLIGGNYQNDRIQDNAYYNLNVTSFRAPLGTGFGDATARVHSSIETYAVFGNAEYNITPQVKLIGGIRYTKSDNDSTACTFDGSTGSVGILQSFLLGVPIPPGGCITATNGVPGVIPLGVHEDNISWRVGVNWQASPLVLLYANVSRGYKAGAVPQLFAFNSDQLRPVRQESLLAYEAGAKISLFDRRLQLNGAVFYYDYTDKQVKGRVPVVPIGNLEASINIPKSRIMGAELQFVAAPVEGLTLSGGVSYTDSRIADGTPGFDAFGIPVDLSGQSFPLSPVWQANADAQYDAPIRDGLNAFIGAALSYRSETNSGLGNLPLQDIPAYTLVDLRFGLHDRDNKWRVTGFVRNLTDKSYPLVVSPVADDTIAFMGRPRTYGVSVSFRY